MDEDTTQDVNQVDETTTDTSSDIEQTTVADEQAKSTQSAEDLKTVPYERFKEVNDTLKEMREELRSLKPSNTPQTPQPPIDPTEKAMKDQVKTALKPILEDMGYVSREELHQKEQDQALESSLQSLEKELSGKDGRPAFNRSEVVDYAIKNGIANPKAAYELMHQAELINFHVQQALTKGKGITAEGSNGSGSQGAGPTDDDLRAAAAKGDSNARQLLLKRISKSTFFRE